MNSEENIDEAEAKQLEEVLKITANLLRALNCKTDGSQTFAEFKNEYNSRQNNGTETE
jgi:ribosomal protein S6